MTKCPLCDNESNPNIQGFCSRRCEQIYIIGLHYQFTLEEMRRLANELPPDWQHVSDALDNLNKVLLKWKHQLGMSECH